MLRLPNSMRDNDAEFFSRALRQSSNHKNAERPVDQQSSKDQLARLDVLADKLRSNLQQLKVVDDVVAAAKRTESVLRTTHENFRIFDEILSHATRNFTHEAYIAGGAIRDTLLGAELKDIDIFVEFATETEILKFSRAIQAYGISEASSSDSDYSEDWKVFDLRTNLFKLNLPIQVIAVKNSFSDHLDTFNIDLSKVAYSNSGLLLTREFMKDHADKTLTVHCVDRDESTQNVLYLQRIMNKYPEYNFRLDGDVAAINEVSKILPESISAKRVFSKYTLTDACID